jgi:hypothetical protein
VLYAERVPRTQDQRINARAKEQSRHHKHDFQRLFSTRSALLAIPLH